MFAEIPCLLKGVFMVCLEYELLSDCLLRLNRAYIAVLCHTFEYIALTGLCRLKVRYGGITAGRLRKSGKKSGLGNGDLRYGFPEIGSCRRLDSVSTVAQIDLI